MTTLNKVTTTKAFQNVSLLGNKNKVQLVTLEQLENVLAETTIVKGMGSFAEVVQLTEPRCTKKCRQTGISFDKTILKLSKVNVILNSEYEKNVTNQLGREGKESTDYKKGQNTMPIEKGENNNFFGYFRNQPVIEYRPNPNNSHKVTPTYFEVNGNDLNEIDVNTLPDVLPIKYKPTNQGTEKTIFWRKLYVKNIVSITLNGVTYQRV